MTRFERVKVVERARFRVIAEEKRGNAARLSEAQAELKRARASVAEYDRVAAERAS